VCVGGGEIERLRFLVSECVYQCVGKIVRVCVPLIQ
jgi:hypothetical protein